MAVAIDPENVMTPRQLELLALYASGHTLAEIGTMKFLSQYTVRNNLLRAQQRVGAKNLTHLCLLCVERGMLQKNGTGYKPVQAEGVVAE